ncbi:MAG: GNAT family N-acetyltransferase [Candidatus Dormibacteraeota bacterium]|nr:GNAT family N-acetyltransferase [Candidatus Dormibacteraeota bacterium]
MIALRRGRPEDAERLAWVHARVWQQAYAGLMPADLLDDLMRTLPRRTQRWRRQLAESPPWVACLDGREPVGFAGWLPSRDEDARPGETGEIGTIYVLQEYWRAGVGRLLMRAALTSLRESGYREATLWVLEGNRRARRFYEAGGWQADGTRKVGDLRGVSLQEVRYRIPLRHRMLCATGALGIRHVSSIGEVLRRAALLPVDGFEFLIQRSHAGRLDEVLPPLLESGLSFPVVHLSKAVGARLPHPVARAELADNLRFAAALGAGLGVLHLWDLPDSDRDLDGRLAAYAVARELADDCGIELGIESIPCSVGTPLRDLRALLHRHPDATLVLDTEFLALHGELAEALETEELWRAVRHLHVKDFGGSLTDADGARQWRSPGEGTIDFRPVSAALVRESFRHTVSLEIGPGQTVDGPDWGRLPALLKRLGTDDWDFQPEPGKEKGSA